MREKGRNKYRELSEEGKNKKREYGRNRNVWRRQRKSEKISKKLSKIKKIKVFYIVKYKHGKKILYFAEVAIIKNNFQRSVSINKVDINRD